MEILVTKQYFQKYLTDFSNLTDEKHFVNRKCPYLYDVKTDNRHDCLDITADWYCYSFTLSYLCKISQGTRLPQNNSRHLLLIFKTKVFMKLVYRP